MKKINDLKYEHNGIVIVFTPIPKEGDGIAQKYSFSIEGDSYLTEKLLNSVKIKKVKMKEIGFCAKALFEIIKADEITALISSEDVKKLFEKFQQKFGKSPIFETEDLSKNNNPWFSTVITNNKSLVTGEGRTKQEARAQALKKCF